jgi:protoporphyrin/coproporphyrin ferrochelatase
MTTPYDSILLVSFGGPEQRDQVIPFLENVLRGKNVPRERMLEVAEHYYHFDGVSPINQQNRDLMQALQIELRQHGIDLPLYWGNRNWHPLLPDTLQQMQRDGKQRALAFFTSAFSSYSGCRQYRENIAAAQQQVGEAAPQVEKLRVFFNHPGYIETMTDRVSEARQAFTSQQKKNIVLLFTAHSIPLSMAENCKYETQLKEACRLVAEHAGEPNWQLVYQSRSGPPSQPWLEPDVCATLRQLAQQPERPSVLLIPIGFISDHMEVLFDLDEEAKQLADELQIPLQRAKTAGTHPRFVAMIRELIQERLSGSLERVAIGNLPASHDTCPIDCCKYEPQRPVRPS